MTLLVLGLVLFLGVHSARILVPGLRERAIARFGEGAWKGAYALLSLGGLVLVGRGWSAAEPLTLYEPPGFAPALLLALMPVLLVLVVAGNLPAGRIRRLARHPMLIATAGWGALHLLANGEARAVALFGGFALWAAIDIASLLGRERAAEGPHGTGGADGSAAIGAGPHGGAAGSVGASPRSAGASPRSVGASPRANAAALPLWPDIVSVGAGLGLYAWLVAGGHVSLFGVSPLG